MFRPLKTYQLIVDLVVAGMFTALVLTMDLRAASDRAWGLLAVVVVAVLFGAALGLRRVAPGLALAVAWAAALVQMVSGRDPAPVDIVVIAVLYTAAAYGTTRVFWCGLASAVGGAVVITLYVFRFEMTAPLSWTAIPTALAVLVASLFGLLLSWTVGALARTAVRARENRRAQVRAEAEAIAEQERVRIARDMHDVVAHSLAVVIAQADGARYAAASDPVAATNALATISTTSRAALSDVRLLLTQLRHSQGDGPQPTLADLDRLFAEMRAAGLDLTVDIDPAPAVEPARAVQLATYRILQEALTNALRHGAGSAVVRLAWYADHVQLEVRNPLGPVAASSVSGHGLIGMGERADLVGGRLNASDHDGAFTVSARLPIRVAS